jgi:hypothetical protein
MQVNLRIFLSSGTTRTKLTTNCYLDTPRNMPKFDISVVNSSYKDIASNVQADFIYVFFFRLSLFYKVAIFKCIPKNYRYIYE